MVALMIVAALIVSGIALMSVLRYLGQYDWGDLGIDLLMLSIQFQDWCWSIADRLRHRSTAK